MSDPEITVTIKALAHGGSGIGPIVAGPEELINKKAFIPNTIPGETVVAKILADKGSYCEAELIQIKESSSLRITPDCPYFSQCGGCQLQHIELKGQRGLKLEMVSSALKIKGIKLPKAVQLIGQDLPGFNYRKRVNLHVSSQGEIGFYKPQSGTVVAIDQCLIAENEINQALKLLQANRTMLAKKIAGITVEIGQSGAIIIFKVGYDFKTSELTELARSLSEYFDTYIIQEDERVLFSSLKTADQVSAFGHFSQVNSAANELLIEKISQLVGTTEQLDDLYSGYGNLCLKLASKVKNIRAIEIDPTLVNYGKQLTSKLNINNIIFYNTSAEKFIKGHALAENIILDPPRSGAKLICKNIITKHTKRIFYISCNLPSLVRDTEILQNKGYQLTSLEVLDMFPQTHHVEIVASFSL